MPVSRRNFVKGLTAAGFAGVLPAGIEWWTMDDATLRQNGSLTPVPIEQVTISDKFWTPKRNVWRSVTLYDCFDKFEEQNGNAFNNFDRVKDGLKGGHGGAPWFDGLVYEMIRAAADFLRSQPDPDLETRLDGYIDRIVAAAETRPDGYVNTYTQLQEPDHEWGLNGGLEVFQHEFYNLGALVDAGVHYYRATGKTKLLSAGIRVADTMANLVGPPPKLNLVPSHELPEEALLGLSILLQEQPKLANSPADPARYQKLAEFWIENRGKNSGKPDWEPERGKAEQQVRDFDYSHGRPSWGEYAQDHLPVFEQTDIVGHAVRATLLASAVAALARQNGRDDYRRAAIRLWESMTLRRMHITGGVGAYAQEEKFGPDYVLPNDAYLETCAAVGAGFFHQNMNQTFGHARYADELERVLYDGVLCGVSLAGDRYTYQNPLASEGIERWSWHGCPCCPPMFLKIMGAMPSYIYATDEDALYVNLFVGSKAMVSVSHRKVEIEQTTNYPWDGHISLRLTLDEPANFALMVRVPAWCHQAEIRVNGEVIGDPERLRGYARIHRTWRANDHVELLFAMPPEIVKPDPRVEANIGRVALRRGPLVYCFEALDNQGLPDAISSENSSLEAIDHSDLLGGITAIRARSSSGKKRELLAIPYFANANRERTAMQVWVPAQD